MNENKENSDAGHHQDIPQSVVSNGHPEKKNLQNGVPSDSEEKLQNG
uniref:Uncharacterized protein n=1 Tax=Romanomermis culicivorax TaxID=13658 RepID=A0A915I128_ROMCU